VEQLRRRDHPRRGSYARAGDDEIIAEIRAITDARPTYGYRRVTALLNRARRSSGHPRLNHKRVFRLMRIARLLLQPDTSKNRQPRDLLGHGNGEGPVEHGGRAPGLGVIACT
jgi:putative transposase